MSYPAAPKQRRPYRGLRGDFVLEQEYDGGWIAVTGANTEAALRTEARRYSNGLSIGNGLRITPNHPGAPLREGSRRP
jgi:hypothetical protein